MKSQKVFMNMHLERFQKNTIDSRAIFKRCKRTITNVFAGKAGSGKSHVIKTASAFPKKFCNNYDRHFDSDVVKLTVVTGCAAASLKIPGATTVHRAAHLTKPPKKSILI